MKTLDKQLDEIIEREGLAADIAESAKFFGDTLPLTLDRKAQHAKAAAQSKFRHSHTIGNDGKAAAICDEINKIVFANSAKSLAEVRFRQEAIGRIFGNWIVIDASGTKHGGEIVIKCQSCGRKKTVSSQNMYGGKCRLKNCRCGKENKKTVDCGCSKDIAFVLYEISELQNKSRADIFDEVLRDFYLKNKGKTKVQPLHNQGGRTTFRIYEETMTLLRAAHDELDMQYSDIIAHALALYVSKNKNLKHLLTR